MATESTRKAHFVGKWHEDTFSDEVLKTIAAHALAEKGKRVKLVLNKDGVRFVKQRIFKEDVVEFYPLKSIKTVTKNIRCDRCIMFILADEVKKYHIIAIRCDSDADAIYITNFFNQFQQNKSYSTVELRKRSDNGNWTLRERSAHNASLHLKEVFKEQQIQRQKSNEDYNGNVIISGSTTIPTKNQNGILKQTSIESESSFPYTADAQLGTTTSEWKAGQITAFSSGGKSNDDAKALLEHSQVAERIAHGDSRKGMTLLADKPKIHDGRIYTTGSQTLGNRRVSGDLALYRQYQPLRATPGRNSMVVKMNSAPLVNGSAGRYRTTSLRIPPPTSHKLSTSSTIRRSIEETYAKPVIIQHNRDATAVKPVIVQQRSRRGSGNSVILSRQQRPHSVHVMGENRLFVLQNGNTMKF